MRSGDSVFVYHLEPTDQSTKQPTEQPVIMNDPKESVPVVRSARIKLVAEFFKACLEDAADSGMSEDEVLRMARDTIERTYQGHHRANLPPTGRSERMDVNNS